MIADPALSVALDAARDAARAVAALGDPAGLALGAVVEKSGAGPATVADLASQACIAMALRRSFGAGVGIVAEESLQEAESLGGAVLVDHVVRAVRAVHPEASEAGVRAALTVEPADGRAEFWTVDPLDGTKGYLRGGQFAVAIALVRDGRPVLGVLAAPRLSSAAVEPGQGIVAVAADGAGAWQSPLASWDARPIRCAPWSVGSPVRVAGSVERSHSASDSLEACIARIGPVHGVRMDSQAKYAVVARGDADCYVRRSPTPEYRECIWDHAAGALVATEAGARVTDVHGRAFEYSLGRRLEGRSGVVCAVPALHGRVLEALASPMG